MKAPIFGEVRKKCTKAGFSPRQLFEIELEVETHRSFMKRYDNNTIGTIQRVGPRFAIVTEQKMILSC
jgi:hypothetical protein